MSLDARVSWFGLCTSMCSRGSDARNVGGMWRVIEATVTERCPVIAPTCHTGATRIMAADAVRRRVLVVEDDAAIRELLRLHLSLAQFDVAEVADGRAALDRARATTFDVIVLDVMLPGIDGVTLCRAFRAAGPNANTGILMLT